MMFKPGDRTKWPTGIRKILEIKNGYYIYEIEGENKLRSPVHYFEQFAKEYNAYVILNYNDILKEML